MNSECSIKHELRKYLLLYCQNIDILYIAFSGGVDSCVLLDAINNLNKELNFDKKIIAIHVNHNISKNAKDWEKFCKVFCEKRNIVFKSHKINLKILKDQTVESVARLERYNIFKNYLEQNNSILITAHHQNDQAETVLLNLFRGSGIDGLSGISIKSRIDNNIKYNLLRPLLNINKNNILDYAKLNNLSWVNDESNFSLDYSRNFLRNEIIPKLQEKWPALISKIAHSADHCFEAKNYLESNIKIHYERSVSRDNFGYEVLDIEYLKNLSETEQKYLIRYFIKNQKASYPSKIKLQEILHQSLTARIDADISVFWKKDNNFFEIKRFRNKIYLLKNFIDTKNKVYKKYNYQLGQEIFIPEINRIIKLTVKDLDLEIKDFENKNLEINFRKNLNANLVKVKINGKNTSLKKYMQESNIPNWFRDDICLVLLDDSIIKIYS